MVDLVVTILCVLHPSYYQIGPGSIECLGRHDRCFKNLIPLELQGPSIAVLWSLCKDDTQASLLHVFLKGGDKVRIMI